MKIVKQPQKSNNLLDNFPGGIIQDNPSIDIALSQTKEKDGCRYYQFYLAILLIFNFDKEGRFICM